jgi:hypothetical protein
VNSRSHRLGKFNLWQKSIAVFLSICFIFSESVSFADAVTNVILSEAKNLRDPSPFGLRMTIPSELGSIEEFHQGTSDKTILYIQDAHDSLEAQENIAKIIDYLVEHYGVQTVFEEGYEGNVPTDQYFGFIKDPRIKEKVSYFLMDKLRIGGAEYAHINRKKNFKLIGVDSIKLHLKNIEWYRKNSEHREETQKDLAALQKKIDKLANQYFTKELKDMMKLKKRLDVKQIPLLNYLKRIWPLPGRVSNGTEAISHPILLSCFLPRIQKTRLSFKKPRRSTPKFFSKKLIL